MRSFLQNLKQLVCQVAKLVANQFRLLLSLFVRTPETKNSIFSISPRLEGIQEQFERAKLFFNEALQSTEKLDRFRRFVAAIYFANAISNIMLDAAKYKEIKVTEGELKKMLEEKLPYCELMIKLRIHDFHRVCLLERPGMFIKGPIELKASKGMVKLQETAQGPIVTKTGNSEFKEQRPLRMKGDKVFDEEQGKYIPLQKVLSDYLDAVPEAIKEFRKLQGKNQKR